MATSKTATVTLPSDEQILITREFDAPRHLVWKAWTTPELIRRWWSGERGEMTVAEVDLRVGGAWRYVMIAEGGFEVAFRGEFHEIEPQERIVNTEIFEGAPGGESPPAVVTQTFVADGDRTVLTQLMVLPDQEIRDTILATGMEEGMQESMDRLELVAASLA